MRVAIFIVLGLLSNAIAAAGTALQVQARISLPDCRGRIDHLAFDVRGRRLFVAELGNDSVAVVDLAQGRLERRLGGFDEPQGVAFDARLRRLYVAEGGGGIVRSFGADLEPLQRIKLPADADNIRIDPLAARVYVGYGRGALAVLDAGSLARVGDIPLEGHPESFQLSDGDARIYVNVPAAREIAVLDRATRRQVASWPTRWRANYPMALDADASVLAVFREPPRIARFVQGDVTADAEICGDADDVFVDASRDRVYVVCGLGAIDVLDRRTLRRLERVPTSSGARTGLYSAEADLRFVAARASGAREAEIWVFKPD
jgi:DNA-binding beta-propeller fold protein YncE